jgi:hypothetical protein
LATFFAGQVFAQQKAQADYPNHPIRIVIPYVAGGPMDFIGRTLGQKLTPVLGQSFIVDNKPGAGGALGSDIVAKSLPDGYTILDTSSSHASLPIVSPALPYDPIKDFQPITLVANSVGFVIAARADLPAKNFTAMLRLDHNRALSQLAAKMGKPVADIQKLAVWGNHSPTMYADYRFATIGGQSVEKLINDAAWNRDVFLPTVGKRGAAIIEARGLSSAASAANAAIDHIRDWVLGTNGKWVTMGIASDGSYGIPEGTMYGVPVTCQGGEYQRVTGLEIDAFSRERMDLTLKELIEERDAVAHLLK